MVLFRCEKVTLLTSFFSNMLFSIVFLNSFFPIFFLNSKLFTLFRTNRKIESDFTLVKDIIT